VISIAKKSETNLQAHILATIMISGIGKNFARERDSCLITLDGSEVIKNQQGREIPEVGEIGVTWNFVYWGAKPTSEYCDYDCVEFPCRQLGHTATSCYWSAAKTSFGDSTAVPHAVFNYELGRCVPETQVLKREPLVSELTMERCAALNFNQELRLYGILGFHGAEDLDAGYLDQGLTLCKQYLKKPLQTLLLELGGAEECLKNIEMSELGVVTDRWKLESPRSTTMATGKYKSGSKVDRLTVGGLPHSPMTTVQYKRIAWGTAASTDLIDFGVTSFFAKVNEHARSTRKIDSYFNHDLHHLTGTAIVLEWSKTQVENGKIVGHVSYGELTERVVCAGAFPAYSDDWKAGSAFSGLLR